jgi:diacylglycerol kinase family enzyme
MFIVNPQARNGRTCAKLEELRHALNHHGILYDVRPSESLEHASALSREANLAGYHTVVAVGGDGTINRVLNGFFATNGTRLSQARMAAIHIGTSPDFCRSHGIPLGIPEAVETLASGFTKPICMGQVSYLNQHPDAGSVVPASSFFACCANVGFGANLARLANGGIRKRVGDFAGTFLCLLRVLRTFRPVTLSLRMDGVERQIHDVYNVAVGRSRYVASGLQIRHRLRAVDPRLYLVCLRALSWKNLIPVLYALYSGRPIRSRPYLSIEYARTISIRSPDRPVELEFDGDPAGWCPADFCVASEAVDLLVPPPL